MTEEERTAYQAETDRLRAANVARVQHDAENLRAYEEGTRAALRALRDADQGTAVLANIAYDISTPAYVISTALMMLRPENNPADVVNMDRDMALVEYRRVLAGRRLDRSCDHCGPDADHSNRDHRLTSH